MDNWDVLGGLITLVLVVWFVSNMNKVVKLLKSIDSKLDAKEKK